MLHPEGDCVLPAPFCQLRHHSVEVGRFMCRQQLSDLDISGLLKYFSWTALSFNAIAILISPVHTSQSSDCIWGNGIDFVLCFWIKVRTQWHTNLRSFFSFLKVILNEESEGWRESAAKKTNLIVFFAAQHESVFFYTQVHHIKSVCWIFISKMLYFAKKDK